MATRNNKKKNHSSKGKRGYRDDRKQSDRIKQGDPGDKGQKMAQVYQPTEVNDFDWYNHNPSLTMGAASVQYPFRPGMQIPVSLGINTGTISKVTIPGICKISWCPTVGQSADNQSPIGIAAREMYGRVRANFSGTLRADAPDMMIYVQAMDSVYAYISWLKRLYRMVNAQSPDNYVVPDSLLMALGFTKAQCTELRSDKMQLFNAVNVLIGMSDKFRVPAAYPFLKRHVWMNDRVYTDAPSLNSQLYIFNMTSVYKFALLNTPDNVAAGGLQMVDLPKLSSITSGSMVNTLYTFGEQLMSVLAASETAYTISGYLERAFEGYPLFAVAPLVLEEKLDFSYDEVVMSQIENATSLYGKGKIADGSNNVTQDPKTNAILCAPSCTPGLSLLHPFINIHHDAPSVMDTVEATRLKTSVIDSTGAILCATEIVSAIHLYILKKDVSGNNEYVFPTQITLTAANHETNANAVCCLFQSGAFDWHPFADVSYQTGSGSTAVTTEMFFGDIHCFATLTRDELMELNRVCVLSEYNCFNGI